MFDSHGKLTRRLCCLIAVITLLLSSTVLQAQTQSDRRAAIEELLILIKATESGKAIFQSLIEQYSAALAKDTIADFEKRNWSPASKERATTLAQTFYVNLSKRLRDEVPERIGYDERVTAIYVAAYDQHFTEAEIRELIAFYKGSVGQKFLTIGPRVASIMQQKSDDQFQALTTSVTRQIVNEELKKLEESARELIILTPARKPK